MPEYELHPDVVWIARPDASSRLIHLGGNACGLDAASTDLLRALLHDGIDGAGDDLAARAGISRAETAADVQTFVAELRRQRILVTRGAGPGRREARTARIADRAIGAGVRLVSICSATRRQRAWGLLLVARAAFRLFGWANTRAAWDRLFPRRDVPVIPAHAELAAAIDTDVRSVASRSWLHHQCKERALTCLALLRDGGIAGDVVIGLSYTPLRAHVWVEAGGRVLSDDPEHCRLFEPIPLAGHTPPVAR